jgi:lactoylglutathione lyase
MNSARPFKVLGIQHIAIGSKDKTVLERLWTDILGLEKTGSFKSEKENVDENILRTGFGAAPVEIDIMQPLDSERKPNVHEPPLNHIGLWIDNLEKAVEWMQKQGVRFTPGGIRKGAGGYNICFIHPKGNENFPLSGEGVLIELVQAPGELIKAARDQ